MKVVLQTVGIAVAALMLVPASADAYSHSHYQYQGQTFVSEQALVAHLLQVLQQLQAQLAALQGGGYGTSPYRIDVETVGANDIDEDSASLFGNVDLAGAPWARVWFEYGETQSFGEKTLTGTARSGGQFTFRADVTGLEEDERYFFRAVGEDPAGRLVRGNTEDFITDDDFRDDDDEEPDVTTEDADDVEEDRAELNGEVDMNDFDDGLVFFVYGLDEDQIEDIENDYDEFRDIDEDGDDLQKIEVEDNFDDDDSFSEDVFNLEEDEEYFFQICVEYEDEDGDETIKCGGVEEFETDDENGSGSDEEPDVTTEDAEHVEEDEAELHGEVDMNDFRNGVVFFVYGEDEDQVEDIEDDYDTYNEIDEDGDDLQKVRMDSDLDDRASYELRVSGLDDDTDYFFQICVEFEDEDDDEKLICGGVEEFTTDED